MNRLFCRLHRNWIIQNKRNHREIKRMALTKYEYVKSFEHEDKLEPLQWIVIRLQLLNPKAFVDTETTSHEEWLRNTMLPSSQALVKEVNEIVLCYTYSNIVNFVFEKETTLYSRRASKLLSLITSYFSSCFTTALDNVKGVKSVPVFEGSLFLLPRDQCLRDFLSREQKDCHNINLEDTVFRNLVKVANFESSEALNRAKNSSESEKNELLFSFCNVNYNNEPPQNKKGTIFLKSVQVQTSAQNPESVCGNKRKKFVQIHEDFKKSNFWKSYFCLQEDTRLTSNFAYLKSFQRKNNILPHTWLVARLDGKGFHRFTEVHNFMKPNEDRALKLMSASAKNVMAHFPTILLAYGHSDEYSFVIKRYGHREKEGYSLISRIVSIFSSTFVKFWSEYFEKQDLLLKPSFDARLVFYPTNSALRDYLSWRQADCHINNMYNTCFWNLVNSKNMSRLEAQEYLKGTFSEDKLRILKDECGIDYSQDTPLHRKGTSLISQSGDDDNTCSTTYEDLIGDQFWVQRPWLLGNELKSKTDTQDFI